MSSLHNGGDMLTLDQCLARAADAYRARLTLLVATIVVSISLSGYGLSEGRPEILLLVGLAPWGAVAADVVFIAGYAVPFLYKAARLEQLHGADEPMTMLLLDFIPCNRSAIADTLKKNDAEERRRAFERAVSRAGLQRKLMISGGLSTLAMIVAWCI